MKKNIVFILSCLLLVLGFASCSNHMNSPADEEQVFSQENLKISINSVQWEEPDKAKTYVKVTPLANNALTVSLHSILQEQPLVTLRCETDNSLGFDKYNFEGEQETPNYEIDVYGIVNNGKLDLRIDYESDYDITGRWMVAATSGLDMGLDMEVPDVRFELRFPEDATLGGEPLPSNEEVQQLVFEVNNLLINLFAYTDALTFSEEGYVNLSLLPQGQELLGMQNTDLGNWLQYYTDNQSTLTLFVRNSLLENAMEEMFKSADAPAEAPFPEIKVPYTLNGQKLRIYMDKNTLLLYSGILWNILDDLSAEELARLANFTQEDPEVILYALNEIKDMVEEFIQLFNHKDAHFSYEINLIPWTAGDRPWSELL